MGIAENHSNRGHVFVVRGKLQTLDVDVVVVPTDLRFSVGHKWRDLWSPDLGVEQLKPEGWGSGSADRSRVPPFGPDHPDRPAVWFIDVAVEGYATERAVVKKIVAGVTKIIAENAGLGGRHGRLRRLVAIPTLGVDHGGLGNVKGDLIKALLYGVEGASALHDVDVVIVAFNRADFAAFQYVRRQVGSQSAGQLDARAQELAAQAAKGDLALFVGAGVSMSSGLPSWGKLMERLLDKIPDLPNSGGESLTPLDLAELISREDPNFRADVVAALGTGAQPSVAHALLAGLGCEEVVTTNFDLLYEAAANFDGSPPGTAVLPWAEMKERQPWLLKMHGDVRHEKSTVLSRSDFVRYDSSNGPAGAAVQALMMSRHLLVVGASMTDDNFLRLAHEVEAFLNDRSFNRRKLGTVLTLKPQPLRQRLFKESFDYVAVSDSSDVVDQSRDLTIFLDAVAKYAAKDTSFLLDTRYLSLLRDEEVQVANEMQLLSPKVESLAQAAPAGPWAALWKSLQDFGAGTSPS